MKVQKSFASAPLSLCVQSRRCTLSPRGISDFTRICCDCGLWKMLKPNTSFFKKKNQHFFFFYLHCTVLWIQLLRAAKLCHRLFFFAYWTSWPETSAIGSAEKTSFEKVVWISGRRVEKTRERERERASVYFSRSLLVCLLLSNQHLLLRRRHYQPCTSWLCKAPHQSFLVV